MAKKTFTPESLSTLISEIKTYIANAISSKANTSHTHSISNVTNLQNSLDEKVPTSCTVNGKTLSSNITLSASDVGAAASSHTHTAENISDLTTYVLSLFGGYKIRVLSETEYANLGTYDASTLYFCYK